MSESPEFGDTGDPLWIEPPLRDEGALPIDLYVAPGGRWRERIFPVIHTYKEEPLVRANQGFVGAVLRLDSLFPHSYEDRGREIDVEAAMVATAETLDWIHAINEYFMANNMIRRVPSIDAEYLAGAVGARNAAHHGLRRVIGVVEVAPPIYRIEGTRWVHTGKYYDDSPVKSLRWVQSLPPDTGLPQRADGSWRALKFDNQERSFNAHLSGRDVRATFSRLYRHFYGSSDESPYLLGPPPPIDPKGVAADSR